MTTKRPTIGRSEDVVALVVFQLVGEFGNDEPGKAQGSVRSPDRRNPRGALSRRVPSYLRPVADAGFAAPLLVTM